MSGPRPCPWLGCRHHLDLEVSAAGAIRMYERPDDDDSPSCSLDVAEHGARTLEEIGNLIGVTRERARQIILPVLEQLQLVSELGEFRDDPTAPIAGAPAPTLGFRWTPEHEVRLAELYESDGLTVREIARRLGAGFSATCDRLSRLRSQGRVGRRGERGGVVR